MKIISHSNVLLASSMLLALSGCGSESFTPEESPNSNAPVHGGDISISLDERDEFAYVSLLGTPSGNSTGEGSATDADGNYLSVKDVQITVAGSNAQAIGEIGVKLNGNNVGVSPSDIAPLLDSDQTHTITLSYNITDGVNSVARQATFTLTGIDFAPEAEGDLVGNYTRDAGMGTVDLLKRVSDADEEPLTASNVVADSGNPFALPFTLNGNMLELDIASVESQIPDGEKVSFNFTYTIADHRFELSRNLTVNVLGVQDIPGAPLILNYFLESSVNETDTVQEYDLITETQDREGDMVVISDLTLDGESELPYGVELDGTMLSIDPHAYFNEVEAGASKELQFLFKVSDDKGNTSDGERSLIVTINGEQTNLVAATGFSAGFEDAANVGPLDQTTNPGGFVWGWAGWACPSKEIRSASARTGDYGMLMEGSFCHFEIHNVIPALENNQKYAMSYWIRNEASNGVSGNPYVPLIADVGDTGLDNRFWLGSRYFDQSLNIWMEHVQLIDTTDTGTWDGYEDLGINFGLLKYDDSYAGGKHDIDDLNMVKFGHFDTAAHDMLMNDFGLFENAETLVVSAGTSEIRAVDGMNKLYVDTTGATEGVTISLPVKAGAIKAGGRYAVSMNAQLTNHDTLHDEGSNTEVVYSLSLSNGTEFIMANGNGATSGPNDSVSDIIITEEFGRSADVDWSQETMTLNIVLSAQNAQYYIDNVRLIAIP